MARLIMNQRRHSGFTHSDKRRKAICAPLACVTYLRFGTHRGECFDAASSLVGGPAGIRTVEK